jgi:methyl-accepting chemotaxis protein
VGIWYVGYKADLAVLEKVIENSTILNQGFMAIVDDKGRVRMHSGNIDNKFVENFVSESPKDWTFEQLDFTPWRYKVIAAYPKTDIHSAIWGRVITIVISAIVLVLVLVAVLSLLTKTLIVNPVQSAMSFANNIAKGRLNNEIHADGNDEINQLMKSLAKMQETLKQFVDDTIQASDSINALSAEFVTATSSTREGANNQRLLSEQVATSMTEMSGSVGEVSKNATDAAISTKEADLAANNGKEIVGKAVASIEALATEVQAVGKVVSQVAEDTNCIGSVLDVIRSISEQTNLLALNAAIEAARAGEQGRGFAVVADEVRTLASRTQASTEEIQGMIQRLQDGSQQAEAQVVSSQKQVEDSVTHVMHVSDALGAIADAVACIADMNTQIASAAEQQTAVAEEVNQNIVEISHMANVTTQNAKKTEDSADKMTHLSNQLRELVNHYRG